MRRYRSMACFPKQCAPAYQGSMMSPSGASPSTVGPMAMAPGPYGPTNVAPTQRVVHPTQNIVRQRNTRYPIEHIYPVHTHHVHNHVREHYHRTVCSESKQDCCYDIQCGMMPRGR